MIILVLIGYKVIIMAEERLLKQYHLELLQKKYVEAAFLPDHLLWAENYSLKIFNACWRRIFQLGNQSNSIPLMMTVGSCNEKMIVFLRTFHEYRLFGRNHSKNTNELVGSFNSYNDSKKRKSTEVESNFSEQFIFVNNPEIIKELS